MRCSCLLKVHLVMKFMLYLNVYVQFLAGWVSPREVYSPLFALSGVL